MSRTSSRHSPVSYGNMTEGTVGRIEVGTDRTHRPSCLVSSESSYGPSWETSRRGEVGGRRGNPSTSPFTLCSLDSIPGPRSRGPFPIVVPVLSRRLPFHHRWTETEGHRVSLFGSGRSCLPNRNGDTTHVDRDGTTVETTSPKPKPHQTRPSPETSL